MEALSPKELLLPLGDEGAMRKAARHVTDMKLTQRATRAYVASLRAEAGDSREPRLTPARLKAQVRAFRQRVVTAEWQKRAVKVASKATPEDLAAVRDELEALRSWSATLLAKLPK